MFKNLFIVAISLLSFHAQAQQNTITAEELNERMVKASKHLREYHKYHVTGTVMIMSGAVISGIGAANSKSGKVSPVVYFGGLVGLIGFGLQNFTAPLEIRRASIQLNPDGIGLSLKKRKRDAKK